VDFLLPPGVSRLVADDRSDRKRIHCHQVVMSVGIKIQLYAQVRIALREIFNAFQFVVANFLRPR
jgi:hypothetical protein